MNFPSIRIEGSIFSPDILDRLEEGQWQRPTDFGFPASAKVKDEIARAWADAQDYWRIFNRKLETVKSDSPATTETRNLWIVPLLGLLGHQLEYQAKGEELNGKNYPISHRVINRGRTAVHIIGCNEPAGLDKKPEHMGRRMSAHAMLQEYLNLTEELYGLVTNGRLLRLLRDSSRLVKLTYLEFDLDRIFTDGLFADFAVLFRLLHVSRLPASHGQAAESIIELYHQDSLDSGARIRDGLSQAVESAIRSFANGFLSHPKNVELREDISSGRIKPVEFYQYLLRLIYRLLFLLVIEERHLVYPLSPSQEKREIYYSYYSLQRLRRLSEKRFLANKRHHDLWLSLLSTFRLFEASGPGSKLGIAPLAGDLFDRRAIGPLSDCLLGNDVLLNCLRSLGLYRNPDTGQIIRVNYAALNVEEFGSVYEGLLEFDPVFVSSGGRIEFTFKQGDERAATGSHYTPDDLVQPLLKHSLDHLIAEKRKEPEPEKALLSLRVADIACGSGHILLAAARRIATELAYIRTGEEQPSPGALRAAVRDVIRECIYGVDLNPLAVELCKVALWLEAHIPGEPLNFLDHHIKCGNAIVGFVHQEDLERGVPDEAFATMPDDDKKTAAALRKQNKAERKESEQQKFDWSTEMKGRMKTILFKWREISNLPEKTPEQIEAKKQKYLDFTGGPDAWLLDQIASIPIAQFYLFKKPETFSRTITDEVYRLYWSGQRYPQGQAVAVSTALAQYNRFFHWFLEFPDIIERGGFDCILGNPPYLGGRNIALRYGFYFSNYIKHYFPTSIGNCDLIAIFLLRAFSLVADKGFLSFLATNSICQGDTREAGLQQVLKKGGAINFAIKSLKWPGKATVTISMLSIKIGIFDGIMYLNNRKVDNINSFLDEGSGEVNPLPLASNANMTFKGSEPSKGFMLSKSEVYDIQKRNENHREVIFPYLNGDDFYSDPEQKPSRFVINFFDWPIENAKYYKIAFKIVEERVKPIWERKSDHSNTSNWWWHRRRSEKLYLHLKNIDSAFCVGFTSKYSKYAKIPSSYIFSNSIVVVCDPRFSTYAVLDSSIHEAWARKYSGSLETRLRYSPSDCFNTFAFPEGLWQDANPTLADIGEQYHEHRRQLMLRLWLGLTKLYNLFHDPELSPELVAKTSGKPEKAESGYQGILRLRELHIQLDNAVRDAYGWSDLDLGHDFCELEYLPENDRLRYTISPEARREVLKRLLTLNHERAAAEAKKQPAIKKTKSKRHKAKSNDDERSLF